MDESIIKLLNQLHYSSKWRGISIQYEWPHVDRIWINQNNLKICLHKIYPIPDKEIPYYHSHPWSFDTMILKGSYRMQIGYGENIDTPPPISIILNLTSGSKYSIDNQFTWHTVEPNNNQPVYSIVTIEQKNERSTPQSYRLQKRLKKPEIVNLLNQFSGILKPNRFSLKRLFKRAG